MRVIVLLSVLGVLAAVLVWNKVQVERPVIAAVSPVVEETPKPVILDASDLTLERFPGAVVDAAGTLGHFGDTLERHAQGMMDDLGIDVHVVTVLVEATGVGVLAPEIFQQRRIGESAPTGGLLILLNPKRKEARIEPSYSLEGVFPDSLLGRMAQDQLAPYVTYGSSGMAVMDVIHHLKDFVILRALRGDIELAEAYTTRPEYARKANFLSGGAGAQVALPDIARLGDTDPKARVPDERRARYAPSEGPMESAEAFLRVLGDLVGDPSLELFTAGSRCHRRGLALAPYESLERLRRIEASRPLRLIERGDRAVVTSNRPAQGFVPVLLQRVDGSWLVDEAETWKNLFFGSKGDYWQKNSNHPYAFGLGGFGPGKFHDIAAWELGGTEIDSVLANLQERDTALYHFLQGEILYRNCWLPLDAMNHYEEALRLAPNAPVFLETLGDRAEYVNFDSLAVSAYEKLSRRAFLKTARVHGSLGDLEEAVRFSRLAVERSAYDLEALGTLQHFLEENGEAEEASLLGQRIDETRNDPLKRYASPVLSFDPPRPVLHIETPTQQGDVTVYNHSLWSVTLSNPSARPIKIAKVQVGSAGTATASGLGNIVRYWPWPSDDHGLAPGQKLSFTKTWGFTNNTGHEQLSYVFDICWRGEGEVEQCSSERVDLFPN